MTNNQLTEAIERYLSGQMDGEELDRFEEMRRQDAYVDLKIDEHRQFMGVLKHYRERIELETRLNAIHDEIDVHELVEEMTIHPSWVVRMWRQHHSKISVAASIAIFAMLTTMFFTGNFKNNNGHEVQRLSDQIRNVEATANSAYRTSSAIANEIHGAVKAKRGPHPVAGGNYKGTGFALSASGYIVTNYHVIGSRYDSIYVQNAAGDGYRAKMVYAEPQNDIAILKITDSSFEGLPALPYNFKKSKSDLGESVYAIGYPEGDSPVMDMGYISSANGFRGDSTAYRVSIPLNPGNSGSPLLNSKGNVIGIVTGRQTQTEGASYAIKTAYLYKALQNVPQDSLSGKLNMSNKNTLGKLNRVQQIKKLQSYVFMVKVY